ncbi:hypothetical protein GCM10008025_21040 [Ornithinibacillus halotolerans]|uniref:Uncharacterized protein n=1 Tax=Ornithinibacillus halotolerans TaxID=1274357 RepID=A0A916RYU7_9BACI|nr:hypothetical protein GCM10008025_21040 [Ornithinibacillus halotolerans]
MLLLKGSISQQGWSFFVLLTILNVSSRKYFKLENEYISLAEFTKHRLKKYCIVISLFSFHNQTTYQ